jgi:hypothetical protein
MLIRSRGERAKVKVSDWFLLVIKNLLSCPKSNFIGQDLKGKNVNFNTGLPRGTNARGKSPHGSFDFQYAI